jgi:transmembrane sensor
MISAEERVVSSVKGVRARAATWIAEYRSADDWDAEAQAKLLAWLAESPSHVVEFLRLEATWDRTDRLAALRKPRNSLVATGMRLRSLLIRVAAGLAVIAVAGTAAELLLNIQTTRTYATAIGKRGTLKLSDGSIVELNTNTVLRVSDSTDQRKVWLDQGEAYFKIEHDPVHPFVVFAGAHRITDLGTKFVIRRAADVVKVALVEGRARLENAGAGNTQSAVLGAGDIATATAQSLAVERQKQETIEAALSWRRGLLVFHHATLAEAAAEFNRYNHEKIAIWDAYSAAQTFNGTLPTTDVAAFVRVTQKTFGLHVTKRGDDIVISR